MILASTLGITIEPPKFKVYFYLPDPKSFELHNIKRRYWRSSTEYQDMYWPVEEFLSRFDSF